MKMNKKLMSISVGALMAMTCAGALADGPQFYGRIELALTSTDTGATLQTATKGVTPGNSGTYLENNFSLVGVKGSEGIFPGIEAIYQLEFQVENTSSSGDTFKPRNSFLGIKTEIGSLLVGRNDTVFKQAEGGVDLFNSTNGDIDRLLGGQERRGDAIWYLSPLLAELITVNATYLLPDNYGNDAKQYALSVTLGDKNLKKQDYYLAGAYNKGIGNIDAFRAVGQLKLGDYELGGLYQNSQQAGRDDDHNTFLVNLAYNLNGVKLKAEFGRDEAGFGKYYNALKGPAAAADIADIEVTNYLVGADYRLSKSMLLFGHYARYEGEHKVAGNKLQLQDDNVFSAGVRYDF